MLVVMKPHTTSARTHRDPSLDETPRWWRYVGYGLLVVAILVTGTFLFSAWSTNAEAMGGRDLGLAISSAFVFTLTVYGSVLLAPLFFIAALIGTLVHYRSGPAWMAVVVVLVPVGWLVVSG